VTARRSSFQPKDLTQAVEKDYAFDAGEFPEIVQTPFGQTVELIRNERWATKLNIEHIGTASEVIPWGSRFCKPYVLEWAYRTWCIERIQSRVDVRPLSLIGRHLGKLNACVVNTPRRLEKVITNGLKTLP
jgi:hypothetical protein